MPEHILGENSQPADQPDDWKLCPVMSTMVPEANALGGVELVLQAVPCAGPDCGKWDDGACSEVTAARALKQIAKRLDDSINVYTRQG